MVRLTIRQALLLKVFKDYGGFNGKKNTQKIIYALQVAGIIVFHYVFKTGFFGPFSKCLEQDLDYLCELGLFIKEPYGRLRVDDSLVNNSFLEQFRDLFKLFENNRTLEYKIVDIFEKDLRTSNRIELAISFIYLILTKEIHIKEELYNAIDKWKPEVFDDNEKEDVWMILLQKDIVSESGELKFPIVKNEYTKEILESYIYIDLELTSSGNKNFIGFSEMLEIVYQDSFWMNFIKKIINRSESKYWDFKRTLEMWHTAKQLKDIRQIEFCEKIAAFANKRGGIIILGITDKIPREKVGIQNIENRLQSLSTILNKWIDYPEEYYEIKEVILKDSDDTEKHCIAIIIAQTKNPVRVKSLDGIYTYPVRLETGLYREEDNSILYKKKEVIKEDNFNFLNLLNKGF